MIVNTRKKEKPEGAWAADARWGKKNCFTHPVVFQLRRKAYNPGLATTLVLLIPYITFVFWYLVTSNLFTPVDWILSFILGIGVSAQLPLWSISQNRKMAQPVH